MVQVSIEVDKRKLREVERLLSGIKRGLPKAMAGAVNDTAKKTKTDISTEIRRKVAIKKRDIDPHIRRTRATVGKPSAKITLSESTRLPLKYFGARQTKKGVTYKIDKAGGRKLIPGAFISQKMGGHVFVRVGAKRFPLRKPMGLSPWGTFVKLGMEDRISAVSLHILHTNLDRRVRFLLLKAGGQI